MNTNKQQYSIEVSSGNDGEAGEGPARRHPLTAHGGELIRSFDDNIKTLWDTFSCAVLKFGNLPFLGWRPKIDGVAQDYVWMSYAQVGERVTAIGSGLASFDLPAQSNIGLYSINRPEWVSYSRNYLISIGAL